MNKNYFTKSFFAAALCFCFIINQNVFSQATFSAKTDFTTGNSPLSVSTADFNGDGKPDFVTANNTPNTISVFFNTTTTGASAPTFSAKTDFATGTGTYSVTTGDFNGDGKPDIAEVSYGSNTVSIFMNTTTPGASTPTFSAKVDFSMPVGSVSVTIADFNGDGKKDFASVSTNSVSVCLNTTASGALTPTFGARTDFAVGTVTYSVSTGDFNGDGKPDLVSANLGSNTVSVLLNTTTTGASTPTFSAKTDFITGDQPFRVSTGDLNGDGKSDIVCADVNTNLVSVFLNTTPPGASTPAFTAKTDFTTGLNPAYVSIADLNNDGKPDLSIVSNSANIISVFLNITTSGSSIPQFATRTDFTTATAPFSSSIGDLNGDGKPDLLVANNGSNSISVFLNTMTLGVGTPSFSAKTDFPTGAGPLSVSIGDFNKDGKPDFVTANNTPNTISVILNTTITGASTPTFSAKTDFATGNGTYSVTSGDFNGDGKPDIAEVSYSSNTVSIFLNTTTPGASVPTFSARTDFSMGSGSVSVTIGDFNGDGKQDFASVSNSALSVFLNTTTPGASTATFSAKTDFTIGSVPYSVSTGDFNGDGKLDLVTANLGSNTVSVLLNTTTTGASTPTFSAKTDFITGDQPFRVSTGDLNGDGKADIVCADVNTNLVSVFLNTTTPGASTPAFTAKTDFTTGLNPAYVSISDINGDGKPDLIVPSNSTAALSVLINSTTPGSTTPAFLLKTDFTTATGPFTSAITDFNGDGLPDIIVTDNDANLVSVYFNTAILPLPVELSSFTSNVNGNSVMLNWNTVSEENNSGFDVERNSFGKGWSKVGFVAGRGTTNTQQNYSFTDNGLNKGRYSYRLKQIDYNGNYKYYDLQNEVVVGVPDKYALMQNYPNPFNPSTSISYEIPNSNFVSLKIYDIMGKEVENLVNENQESGFYTVKFDASKLSSGIYFYKLVSDKFSAVKKLLLVK